MKEVPTEGSTGAPEESPPPRGRGVIPWIVAVALIVAAGYLYLNYQEERVESPPPAVEQPAEAETDVLIRNPVPEPAPPLEDEDPLAALLPDPLPMLDDSDAVLLKLAEFLLGKPELIALVVPQDVVRRIVTAVDNLTVRNVPQNRLPLKQPEGKFLVVASGDEVLLDPANHPRYDRYAALMNGLDARRLVDAYVHLYPLFQNAYRELGYPKAYFNDRLILALDNLLATPDVQYPIPLTQPAVMYHYADPRLEALSAGQKLLLRMGPENAAVIKKKLAEIRQELLR